MAKIALATLPLTLALLAVACGTAATTTSPTPSAGVPTRSATPTPGAVATATATPTASPRPPEPTPVVLTVSGHVTLAPEGRPVPGVRLRIAPFALSGGCPTACPRPPGPDVVVTSDASGAYSAAVSAWTLEALANSSSSQLSLFVTPPSGMTVVAVTRSITFPMGPLAPNDPQWYFMLARDLNGPIDITLAAR
jgi:hypothetical protein